MEMAQSYKLNRKACARLSRAFFWHKFEGATALLAQTNTAEQHVGRINGFPLLWNKSVIFTFGSKEYVRVNKVVV